MEISPNQMRVKKVHDDVMKDIAEGRKPNVSKTMLKHGYSESSAHSLKVTQTATWKQLMAEVQDEHVVARVYGLMMQDKDRRTALSAADMLLKLKDRYPANKFKHTAYDEREEVLVE